MNRIIEDWKATEGKWWKIPAIAIVIGLVGFCAFHGGGP